MPKSNTDLTVAILAFRPLQVTREIAHRSRSGLHFASCILGSERVQ